MFKRNWKCFFFFEFSVNGDGKPFDSNWLNFNNNKIKNNNNGNASNNNNNKSNSNREVNMWLSEREVTVRLSKSSAVIPLACVQYTYERIGTYI